MFLVSNFNYLIVCFGSLSTWHAIEKTVHPRHKFQFLKLLFLRQFHMQCPTVNMCVHDRLHQSGFVRIKINFLVKSLRIIPNSWCHQRIITLLTTDLISTFSICLPLCHIWDVFLRVWSFGGFKLQKSLHLFLYEILKNFYFGNNEVKKNNLFQNELNLHFFILLPIYLQTIRVQLFIIIKLSAIDICVNAY